MRSKDSKICHNCGREIPRDAEKCKFCGAVWKGFFFRYLTRIIAFIGLVVNLILLVFVVCQIEQADKSIELIEKQVQQNKDGLDKADTLILTLRDEGKSLQEYITIVREAVLGTKEAVSKKEKQFIEENKPIVNVSVTKARIEKDTLWVSMHFENEGKQKAADVNWTTNFLGLRDKKLFIVPIPSETTDILAGHSLNNRFHYFSKDRDCPADPTVLIEIVWRWRGYNILYGDTIAYLLKRNPEKETEWDIYREYKESAVKICKALDKIQQLGK
jgi:hypothetical protein